MSRGRLFVGLVVVAIAQALSGRLSIGAAFQQTTNTQSVLLNEVSAAGALWIVSLALSFALLLASPNLARIELLLYQIIVLLICYQVMQYYVSHQDSSSPWPFALFLGSALGGTYFVVSGWRSAGKWVRNRQRTQKKDPWKSIDEGTDPTL